MRVYQEDPLIIHYAKRASTQHRIDTVTKEAAAVFESLPGHLKEEITEDLEAFGTELIGVDIRELLNPIPPPFQLEAIANAEQVPSDGHKPSSRVPSSGSTTPADRN